MNESMQDGQKRPVTFKVPPDVLGWLQEKATAGYRTVNSQVLLLVKEAMQADQRTQQ